MGNYIDILKTFIPIVDDSEVSLTPNNLGHINTTLKVEIASDNQVFILQKINHHIFKKPEVIMNSIEIINKHLKSKDYPYDILEIIPNLKGNFLSIDDEGCYWRMTKFIPNTYCITKVENRNQAFEAAKTLSIFYSKILDLDPSLIESSIPGFIDFEKRINDYMKALEEAPEERKNIAKDEINFVEKHINLPDKFVQGQKKGDFPIRVVHADPKISNVLFDEKTHNGRSVIDFDTLMPATILYDFGDMVRSYTNLREEDDPNPNNVFSREYYNAVKEGFLLHTADLLSDKEKENLDYAGQVVVFIQAVRFLTDFLDGDKYYKTKYPTHNLDRTKNQINLLKELLLI